jgi:hypothetical protein
MLDRVILIAVATLLPAAVILLQPSAPSDAAGNGGSLGKRPAAGQTLAAGPKRSKLGG